MSVMSFLSLFTMLLLFSCSSNKFFEKKIDAHGSLDNNRPFWTYDGGWKIQELRKYLNDSETNPSFVYFINSASVKVDTAIPQCFSMANMRASANASEEISQKIKSNSSLIQTGNDSAFYNEIKKKSSSFLTGLEIIEKYSMKLESSDAEPYRCWIVLRMPMENYKKMKNMINAAIDKASGENHELAEKTKSSVDESLTSTH